ncbi:MAG: menaquinone biosynthesis protein [Planctomycetales bacterium]|nr:menaquinone biosynthesis protein [Planctomycetales bacterium]
MLTATSLTRREPRRSNRYSPAMPASLTNTLAEPIASRFNEPRQLSAVGAVNYLNSKPLIEGLDQLLNGHATLRLDYPSRLADDLASGRLDVALIPSIEYFRGQNYEVISDACVAAHGPVLSVKLYSRVPWGDVKSVALDEGSRTSATLARILLAERHGVFPKLEPLPLDHRTQDSSADAILLIGDRAINPPNEQFLGTWDLGEEWLEWTGLPFVFAMWVGRRVEGRGLRVESKNPINLSSASSLNPQPSTLDQLLSASRDLGIQRLDDIARREAPLLGLSLPTTVSYLSENLQYHLGPAERNGLKLFYELAAGMGLAPAEVELRFRQDSSDRSKS